MKKVINRKYGVDINEAPPGFYATIKINKGYNICRDCDARNLCISNDNNWCEKNRCMSYDVTKENGELLKGRADKKSVIFKKKSKN